MDPFGAADDGDDLQQVLTLQNIMLKRVEGKVSSDEAAAYSRIRKKLMASKWKAKVPRIIATSYTIDSVWGEINKFPKWEERRQYIRGELSPLLAAIEGTSTSPASSDIDAALKNLTADEVQRLWTKAQERLRNDPDGAITAARALLESVCKLIAVDLTLHDDVDKLDLPQLYTLIAKALSLSPSTHTEPVFKEILSGCFSVVNGFAALRNKLSDAHGVGPKRVNPAPRHAALAVGLAGTMSMFLLESWQVRRASRPA